MTMTIFTADKSDERGYDVGASFAVEAEAYGTGRIAGLGHDGTSAAAGSESHSALSSIHHTARRQGKDPLKVLAAILTEPTVGAGGELFADSL